MTVPPPSSPATPVAAPEPRAPGLDSLRGFAVAAVVAYHLGHLRGGFLGVDLFFVLSGYLVTERALREVDRTGRLDLRAFWGRRIRRLGPALFVMVPVVLTAAVAIGWDRRGFDALGWDAVATLTWWSNWRQAFGPAAGYWTAEPSLFRHAWSLSVEEQFYVLWPLLLTGAVAVGGRRGRGRHAEAVGLVALGLATVSAAWSVVLARRLPVVDLSRVYVGTDTRLVTPLLGAVLAAALFERPAEPATRRGRIALAVAGLGSAAALAVLVARIDVSDPRLYRTGLLPGVALLAAVLVAAARTLRRTDPVSRWLGRRSYAIYLWSWPLQVLLRHRHPDLGAVPTALLVVGASLLLAEISWRTIESPIQARRGWARRPTTRRRVGAVLVATATVATAHVFRADRPPLPESPTIQQALDAAAVPPATAPPGSPGAGGLPVAVFGDSVAFMLVYQAPPAGAIAGISSLDGKGLIGCGLLAADGYEIPGPDGHGWQAVPEVCALRPRLEDLALARRPAVVLVVSGAWESSAVRAPDGTVLAARSPELERRLIEELVGNAQRAHAVGARTLFLSFACPGAGGGLRDEGRRDPTFLRWYDGLLREAARDATGRGMPAAVLEPTDAVCVDGDPAGAPTAEKDAAFEHEVHTQTPAGAAWAWERWLGPAIVADR